jgi:TP901 family phage tail tape measure protein
MASSVNLGLNFEVKNLESILSDLKKATDKVVFPNPNLKLSKDLILSNLQDAIDYALKALQVGELDPSKLGLAKIMSNIESLLGGLSKKTTNIVTENLTKLRQEVADYRVDIENLRAESDAYEDKIEKQVSPDQIKKQAREQTGFTGQAINADTLEKARKQLEKLQDLESKDPKVKEKIKFYKKLVALYEKVPQKLNSIKQKEEEINEKIKAREELMNKKNLIIDKEENKIKGQRNALENELLLILQRLGAARNDSLAVSKKLKETRKEENRLAREGNKTGKEETKNLGERATAAFSYYLVFNQLKKLFNDSLNTIKQLDKTMTDAAVVTSMNRKEAWALLGTYQNLAKSTGLATSEIANVVTQFLRQGRSIGDAMKLAEVAAKSAKVAGISAQEAVNYLTSAVNGFGLAANQSEMIADKFAAIASRSATSFEELAIAMSKVSPTAKSAGVSVDFMMGVIAKGIETTREAPENIGTAFKTIFARMREVTDLGKSMEDGMSLNRVEKALKSVGVPLRDVSGQFRNLEEVLLDVGNKWQTLSTVEQAYLATALAGSRQQPRLLAIFNNFARTKELIQISADATGALANQHVEYMKGSEAALANLKTAWEQFTMAFVDAEFIIAFMHIFASVISGAASIVEVFSKGIVGLVTGIGLIGLAIVPLIVKLFALAGVMFLKANSVKLTTDNYKALNAELDAADGKVSKLSQTQLESLLFDNIDQLTSGKIIGFLIAKGKAAIGAALGFIKLGIAILVALWPILAVIAAIGLLVLAFNWASMSADHFAKQIAENNKKLDELSSKERDMKKLVDRFRELNSIVAQSAQEFDEMKDLADQLKEIEFEGKKFRIVREDITGRLEFNESEYNAYLRAVRDARNKLNKANEQAVKDAFHSWGANAAEVMGKEEILTQFKKMGYNYGLNFISGLGRAFQKDNPEIVKQLTVLAERLGELSDFKDFFDNSIFFLGERYDRALAQYKTFIQGAMGIAKNSLKGLDAEIKRINNLEDVSKDAKTGQIFKAMADAYAKAIQDINTKFGAGTSQATIAIRAVSETMQDGKILDILINQKQISVDAIVKMSVDMSLKDIDTMFTKFQTRIDTLTNKAAKDTATTTVKNAFAAISGLELDNIFALLFSGVDTTITEGFGQLDTLMDALVSGGVLTRKRADELILLLSNSINTISFEDAGKKLKDQMDDVKKIFNLAGEMAKGDFSKFSEMVGKYGLENVKKFLSKDIDDIIDVIKEANQEAIIDIKERIAVIEGNADTLGRDTTDIEKEEIAALEILLQYYEQIAVEEALRNFRLNEAKELLKQSTDLLSLQQKLMDLNVDFGLIDMLESMAQSYHTDGMGYLITQMTADLDALNEFMTDDGFFNPDDLGRGEAAIQTALGTFTQLIDAVTAAYQRQKKEVEERYRAEIDAIKKAHSEKWTEIDFTNKLAEAEEKILEARRKLMGFAISGVSRGTLEQAQKDLQKLQLERQKMIEDKAVQKAEKDLEMKMNDELIKVQQQLTSVLNNLIEKMESMSNIFLGMTEASESSGDGEEVVEVPEDDPDPNDADGDGVPDEDEDDEFEGPQLSEFENLALATVENTEAVKDLTDKNEELIEAINDNTDALLGKDDNKPTSGGGGGGVTSTGRENFGPVVTIL